MNYQEVYNKVSKIGNSVVRKSCVINKVDYWPLFKCWLYRYYYQQESKIIFEDEIGFRKCISSVKILLFALVEFFRLNRPKAIIKSKYILLSYIKHRYDFVDNKKYNRFIDPLQQYIANENEIVNVECVSEFEFNSSKGNICNNSNKIKFDIKKSFKDIFSFLTFNAARKSKKRLVDDLLAKISEIDNSIDASWTGSLLKTIAEFEKNKNYFSVVLQNLDVEYLCMYSYYFPSQMGILAAAKERGIRVVDFQHASQNKYHYGYGNWCLKSNEYLALLPDEFWVYTQKEFDNLNEQFANSKHQIKIVGNLWLDVWKKNVRQRQLIKQELNISNSKVILIAFQNFMPDDHNLIWEFVKAVSKTNTYFLLRLHPSYLKLKGEISDKLMSMGVLNFEVEQATKWDLYSLLSEIDYCCVFSSTVGEEAFSFNKEVLIFDDLGSLYYEYFIKLGKVKMMNSEKKLITWYAENL